jgi:hypothetical protein
LKILGLRPHLSPELVPVAAHEKGENVMKLFSLKNIVNSAAVAAFAFVLAGPVLGQNPTEEYREWQRAQREAQEELRDYQRSRSRRDYRDYQQANRQAQREYREYINSRNRTGSRVIYNDGRVTTVMSPYYGNTARWYRVNRGGRYYRVDNRSAEMLQRAVNVGYQQGYYEGQRDRQYRDGYSYYDEPQYRSGMYGYSSYVDRDLYQYYFQQGFQRGYEDGFRSTYRYGYRSNTGLNILGNVLGTILQLAVDND